MKTRIGGVDAFHLVNDRVMRARGLAGNHCLFAATVEGHLDVQALIRRLERATSLLPELRRRLVHTPAGPAWLDTNTPAPPLRVRTVAARDIDAALETLADARVSGDAPWAADLLRAEDRDVFVWRWFHPFTDAKGAERFVAWLGSGDDPSGPPDPPPPEDRFDTGTRPLAKLDRKARIAAARTYGDHMLKHARTPIVSLATLGSAPLRGPRAVILTGAASSPEPRHPTRAIRIRFTEDETRAFDRRVRERAKLAESSVMVFASARLYDAILRGRGLAPPQHLVPVPLSLDPKAGATRMFGNNLTMMTFALRRDDLADLARAVATLGDQQRAIVREKLDVGMLASLEFAKPVPAGIYHWFLTRPFHGEVSSFVFSNPGPATIATFAGRRVTDAYALPTVATPPGFQVIFSRHSARLSAIIGFASGLLTPEEEAPLADRLRAELLGI